MRIDIFSDLVCPWCFIGKRRLDRVLGDLVTAEPVELRWRAFQLRPEMPAEGVDRGAYLQRRYGAEADPARVPTRIASEAAEEGIDMDFAAMQRMPNTHLGHRLMAFAEGYEKQHELADVLFRYYFCDGKDVGDRRVLVAAGAEVGLSEPLVLAALADADVIAQVDADLAAAADKGVTGVPCFLLGGSFALPGVQSPEVIGQFIHRAIERLT